MTAFIKFCNPYYRSSSESIFKEILRVLDFTITQEKADLVIMDYYAWRNTPKDFLESSFIVIICSTSTLYNYQYVDVRREVPKDVMLIQEPIDYEFHMSNILDRLNYWDKNE